MKILLVEDDQSIASNIKGILSHFGYALDHADSLASGLTKSRDNTYDLILLDWMLPDGTGVDLCKTIRSEGCTKPICMITAKTQVEDLVTALDSGADDYLTKPFDMVELLARVRSLLRRSNTPWTSTILTLGDLTLNTNSYTVTRAGKSIDLRPKEFAILEYLLAQKCHTVSRENLYEHVWDESAETLSNTLDVHIRYLRQKIDTGFTTELIKTVKGKGYMICDE